MKFLHLRVVNEDMELYPTGGITFCYNKYDNGTYEFNYAICSDKDVFSKKRGRDIAEGRFMSFKTDNFFVIAKDKIEFLSLFHGMDSHKMQKTYPLVHHKDVLFDELISDHLEPINPNTDYF